MDKPRAIALRTIISRAKHGPLDTNDALILATFALKLNLAAIDALISGDAWREDSGPNHCLNSEQDLDLRLQDLDAEVLNDGPYSCHPTDCLDGHKYMGQVCPGKPTVGGEKGGNND